MKWIKNPTQSNDAAPSDDSSGKKSDSASTGDDRNIAPWAALMILSALGMTGIGLAPVIGSRRRRRV